MPAHGTGRLDPVHSIDGALKQLSSAPYSSFFKTPFHRVAYGRNGFIEGSFAMTPGDFCPGSAFDVFYAAREYISNDRLYLPRLYLYPEARCQSRCKLCQFHSRHKQGGSLSKPALLEVMDKLADHRGGVIAQSLIVSGDGEPLIYPEIANLLGIAAARELRVFLTTNLLVDYRGHSGLYEKISFSCDMVTVSIKGLTPSAYTEQQGLAGKRLFGRVLENLKHLSDIRRKENPDMLLGVASLVLPENSGEYLKMLRVFHDIGVDYVYFNQVEPSPEHWGITFSEDEQAETLSEFALYAERPYRDMVVRCSADPFRPRSGNSVYYDASALRENPGICGSALFNPLVMSEGSSAQWFSCRNSSLFTDMRFRVRELTADGMKPVMEAAAGCHDCRLERQVKHMDRIISIERLRSDVDYYLVFDTQKIETGGYAFIQFDEVVK